MDLGTWSEESRDSYNLVDAISRCTVQVQDTFSFSDLPGIAA